MATNAARYRMVAGKHVKLLEFGLRRAQGPDGGLSASKYSYTGTYAEFAVTTKVKRVRKDISHLACVRHCQIACSWVVIN